MKFLYCLFYVSLHKQQQIGILYHGMKDSEKRLKMQHEIYKLKEQITLLKDRSQFEIEEKHNETIRGTTHYTDPAKKIGNALCKKLETVPNPASRVKRNLQGLEISIHCVRG